MLSSTPESTNTIGPYHILEKINEGIFATVYKGYDTIHLRYIAIKKIKKGSSSFSDSLRSEFNLMKELNCPFLIKFYDFIEESENFYIIEELCDENIQCLLNRHEEGLDDLTIKEILLQLNEVFHIMKNLDVVHRDLKLQNILVKYHPKFKDLFVVKLSDFGINREFTQKIIGDQHYLSPEILDADADEEKSVFKKSDLWSLGVIVYYMKFKKMPISKFYAGIIPENSNNVYFDDLVHKLLKIDQNERISWEEYFAHPFFFCALGKGKEFKDEVVDNKDEIKDDVKNVFIDNENDIENKIDEDDKNVVNENINKEKDEKNNLIEIKKDVKKENKKIEKNEKNNKKNSIKKEEKIDDKKFNKSKIMKPQTLRSEKRHQSGKLNSSSINIENKHIQNKTISPFMNTKSTSRNSNIDIKKGNRTSINKTNILNKNDNNNNNKKKNKNKTKKKIKKETKDLNENDLKENKQNISNNSLQKVLTNSQINKPFKKNRTKEHMKTPSISLEEKAAIQAKYSKISYEPDFNSTKNPTELTSIKLFNSISYSLDNQFTIFTSNNIKKYLISFKNETSLDIFSLNDFSLKFSVSNIHKETILCIKHFTKKRKDYIATSSKDNSIKIFEFTEKEEMNLIMEIKNVSDNSMNNNIFSFLIFTTFNDDDVLISSCYDDNSLKLFKLEDKNAIVINENFCVDKKGVQYIEKYVDNKNNKIFIITSNNYLFNPCVKSYNFDDGSEYHVYNNVFADNVEIKEINNILTIFFAKYDSNLIFMYDFHEGNLINKIELKDNLKLFCVLLWNEEILLCGGEDKKIHIISIENKNEINNALEGHDNWVFSLKKIKGPNGEDMLVSQGFNNDGIKIWY